MTKISALLDRFSAERPVGNVLDQETIQAQMLASVSFYAGYAAITSQEGAAFPSISVDTEISDSEWALIRPLFLLYVERENALHLEASRSMGVDVYGRSSSEISGEITLVEGDMPRKAFFHEIVTI